jgi:hypothetical protein
MLLFTVEFTILIFFEQYWRLNSGPHCWQAGRIPLKPHHQPFLLLDIYQIGFQTFYAWASLNHT